MNSEELEQSLRTEFESYLKTVLADLRQEAAEFHSKVEAEVDKHKAQLDEAFKTYTTRFDSDHTFDDAFRASVAEHLRLARDEGARITANAMDEAQRLAPPPVAVAAPPVVTKYDNIRDAVNEISGKDSQSSILKALVQHASEFAPRGAFFIIKNEHFVGWKVFGAEDEKAEDAVREIHFATSTDTILGSAVRSLSTVAASNNDHPSNGLYLEPLGFGHPDQMYSIPLVARGRVVAVLYADKGLYDKDLNLEALETLVRVAGLTVELLAASQTAKAENRQVAAADFEEAQHESDPGTSRPVVSAYDQPYSAAPVTPVAPAFTQPLEESFAFTDSVSYEGGFPAPVTQEFEAPKYEVPSYEPTQFEAKPVEASPFDAPTHNDVNATYSPFDRQQTVEPPAFNTEYQADTGFVNEPPVFGSTPVTPPTFGEFSPAQESPFETNRNQPFASHEPVVEDNSGAMVFDSGGSIEKAPSPFAAFEQPVETYEPAAVVSGGYTPVVEAPVFEAPVIEAPAPPTAPKARLSDRPVDLPIEVPEEERRIHNDARRFARLLVSEIKLYNEKKVLEGREANDLYDRLREAIDRSREMYDKRVQPPVAAKFDYFHYEIVNSLAEGHAERLGSGYPGASV